MSGSYIRTDERDTFVIVGFSVNELDVMHAQPATEEMIRYIKQGKPRSLVLDLRSMSYIDSTGLRSLLLINRQVLEYGHIMVAVCNAEPILQLFNVSEVDSFFTVFSNLDDAVEYMNTRGL